jgi:outer membrane protein assembly factor BamB
MRRGTGGLPAVLLALCLAGRLPAAELERVISHENPLFQPEVARLMVGRDGVVYLAQPGKSSRPYGFVLRMSRRGLEKFGAEFPFGDVATANKDGVVAMTHPAYGGHRIALYDARFRPIAAGDDDFHPDSYQPVHVEAGAGGDFYGLDAHRRQVVRLSPAGRRVRTYPLPDGLPKEKHQRTYLDFRVCEKARAFYLLIHPEPPPHIVCVGFDGKERWTYDGRTHILYTADANRVVGAFDVDDEGALHVLDGEAVKKVAPDGKPLGEVKLRMGDGKPGTGGGNYGFLRVHGDDLLLKRAHPTELFRRYDRKTGALEGVVSTEHERLTVSFDTDVWTAGRPVPLRIRLAAGERLLSPRWRVWARPFASLDYREFPLKGGAVQVPADCAGLYLVKVSPDALPWLRGATTDHLVRTVVEVRQPGTTGSVTVLTPDNRSHFARGEEVPFSVAVCGAEAGKRVALTVSLVGGGRTLASEQADAKGDEILRFRISKGLTARLRPGRYALTVAAPGLSCAGQPLVIGPGPRRGPAFHLGQHGDYGQLYPLADAWDAPDLVAAHAARTAKLGVNLMVDRVGYGEQLNNLEGPRLTWDPKNRAELDALARRLQDRPGGVAPQRATQAAPLPQTLAAYGAVGVEQMAGLVSMDAGLPLGKPFDGRKPEDFTRDLARVTRALAPYPSFRGWSWAANWWVWQDGGSGARLRAPAARTPQERAAYEAAWKRAQDTGEWDPVLGKVADVRLGYAVQAQGLFNTALKKLAPRKVTAVSGPYRALELYPPLTFRNVDEVQLHYQAEQIQWPHVAPHNVDYQKRPGKRAWGHPELFNDAGTGDQVLPALFQMAMRGADGVGCSGAIPNWGPQPEDPRNSYQGTTSIYRAAFALLKQYGPWLTTLRNNDQVAIVVSGRMCRIDQWGAIGGRYFDRLFEAYQSCLRAHHPASFVFVEDLSPDGLKRYKAVLVVGQTVEMEPALAEALRRARVAGTAVFCDGTCRAGLVKELTPLGISFDKIEKDPGAWQDDSAYLRFPGYYRANRAALTKALGRVLPPVAGAEDPDVLLSERAAEDGRYFWVVNDTVPDLDPGQLWRVTLAIATRVPLVAPVKLREAGAAVYDVFALRRVTPRDGVVEADLRSLPARLYAVLPAAIARVELRGPKRVRAGGAFAWSASVQDGDGRPIRASVPVRVRLLDAGGRVLDEELTAAGSKGALGTMRALLNAAPGAQTLEATELFSGRTARLPIAVEAAAGPARLSVEENPPDAPADTAVTSPGKGKVPAAAEALFGPHVRDLVLAERGTLAVASAMNWDHNLYAVDAGTGELRWRRRVGHYFAFAPEALSAGLAVQGYDLKSAEGYHLYLLGGDGKPERRFALYGLPRRLPHRFLPGIFLADRINNLAVPPDPGWVASAGDLGLAVWSREGKLLWSQDWWKGGRHTARLAALGPDTLLAVEGMTATAYVARSGERRWQLRLAPGGEAARVVVSPDGKTSAVQAGDGRVHVLRDGKLLATIPGNATVQNLRHLGNSGTNRSFEVNGLALSASGSLLAIAAGNHLKLYSVAGGLRWVLPADDTLHSPRFSADGKRLAVGSELGTLYVVSAEGDVLLERDLGALPVPAWLPDGDLLAGTWTGTLCRLDGKYAERWRTRLRPSAPDMRGKLLAGDGAPTARIAFRGNAEEKPAPLTPNLLDPKSAFIKLVWQNRNGQVENGVLLAHASAALMDGKPDAPAAPWIGWPQMNWYAEGDPSTYLLIDTYRTRLRVTGVTLAEDPAHPQSWLRDAAFEYWDAARERWVFVQALLSDAAVHTHRFAKPVEAARFRIALPKMLCGNLRLGEVVLHGERLGCSHPDVVARRPVAVLFDEGDDLSGYLHRAKVTAQGAYSGNRCLTVGGEEAYSYAPWPEGSKVFGHTLPNWDFEVAEEPKPGQYRYLQFAWRALAAGTRGISLRLDGEPANTYSVTLYAGERPRGEGLKLRKVADEPPREWTVVRVDLWEVFKAPVRIRGMALSSPGGSAAFDQVLLARTEKDRPAARK